MRVRPDPLALCEKFAKVCARVEAHPPGDPAGWYVMVVAHATGEGELPGLRVRQGRQLVVVAADGGKLGLKDFLPPRLLLRAQQVRALAVDGGQGNVVGPPAGLLLANQSEELLVGRGMQAYGSSCTRHGMTLLLANWIGFPSARESMWTDRATFPAVGMSERQLGEWLNSGQAISV